jgi:hypothetical protein
MNPPTLIETWFTKPNAEGWPLLRWGFLGILLILFGINVWLIMDSRALSNIDIARRLAVPTMLITGHLAFYFPWSKNLLVMIRSLAYISGLAGLILVFLPFYSK